MEEHKSSKILGVLLVQSYQPVLCDIHLSLSLRPSLSLPLSLPLLPLSLLSLPFPGYWWYCGLSLGLTYAHFLSEDALRFETPFKLCTQKCTYVFVSK